MCFDARYFTKLSDTIQRLFKQFFYSFGLKLESHPCMFIVIGVLITLACGTGLIVNFFMETRFLYLMIPRDSEIWRQYTNTIDVFGEPSAVMSLLISVANDNDNILTPQNMNTVFEIHKSIYTENNKTRGTAFNDIEYGDICLTPYASSYDCMSDMSNIFSSIFHSNQTLWNDQTLLLDAINNNPLTDLFIGGIRSESSETAANTQLISGATMINFVYELESYGGDTDDTVYEYMKYWNDYWLDHSQDYVAPNGLNIYYVNDRSLDDEIWRVVFGDLELFAIAFGLMITYFIFALGKLDCINTRMWLAFSVGAVLICALVCGFGIGLLIGGELSLIVMLIPYVILGVGVDNMIIIVHSYDESKKIHKEHILAHSLQASGITITLTSMCSCVALLTAAILPGIPPLIQTFGLMGCLSFFANYCMQFLLFVPLLLFDEKRKEKKGNFCCCCLTYDDGEETENDNKENEKQDKCNGDDICSNIMVNIMRFRAIRCFIIILFIAFAIYSLLNISNVSTQSNLTLIVPDDSPIIDYYDELEIGFNDKSLVELQVVIENTDFSNSAVRWTVLQFLTQIEEEIHFIAQQNWLQPFIQYLDNLNVDINDLNTNEFYQHLQTFAHNETAANSEIIYKRNSFGNVTGIEATRFYIFAFQDNDGAAQWDEYKEWNNLLAKYEISGYIFHSGYGFSYLSSIIVSLTTENMLSACFGVFFILLLSFDFRMSIFVLIVVILIDIDLVGSLYIWDFSLNAITYSILVMAVGLTVDYVIHISFAILEAKHKAKNNFNKMLEIGMKNMGTSVLNGAFTSLLGGIPLLFSQSFGFRTFGAMWVSIIVIAVFHGFLFVPSVLGEVWALYMSIYHPTPRLSSVVDVQVQIELNQTVDEEEQKYDEYDEKQIETNLAIAYATQTQQKNRVAQSSNSDIVHVEMHSIDLVGMQDVMADVLEEIPDYGHGIPKSVE